MVLPKDRVVYRGMKDMVLPEAFFKEDRFGVRGGVEFGLMSTSKHRSVATQYAGTKKVQTVYKIGVGAVDRGASLEFLSQYPKEEEILFPPMSYLEVTGETLMEVGKGGKVTRVVSLSVNANHTCGMVLTPASVRPLLSAFALPDSMWWKECVDTSRGLLPGLTLLAQGSRDALRQAR